ncbi:MAG: hypothetical protein DRP42_03755 [Tenericutes bacterium]|nr:MAG: hypothetical protein DRP42_03755 [Mycoplasmatota bacterium]
MKKKELNYVVKRLKKGYEVTILSSRGVPTLNHKIVARSDMQLIVRTLSRLLKLRGERIAKRELLEELAASTLGGHGASLELVTNAFQGGTYRATHYTKLYYFPLLVLRYYGAVVDKRNVLELDKRRFNLFKVGRARRRPRLHSFSF